MPFLRPMPVAHPWPQQLATTQSPSQQLARPSAIDGVVEASPAAAAAAIAAAVAVAPATAAAVYRALVLPPALW